MVDYDVKLFTKITNAKTFASKVKDGIVNAFRAPAFASVVA